MITNRVKSCIKYFLIFKNQTTFANLWDWDQNTDSLTTAKSWYKWNAKLIVFAGYTSLFLLTYFTVVQAQTTYDNPGNLLAFQTIAWMEISINGMILLLYHHLHRKCPERVFVFNQMLSYTEVIQERLNDRKRAFNANEQTLFQQLKQIWKYNEFLFLLPSCGGIILTAWYAFCTTSKDEPVHQVLWWLIEISLSLNLQSLPILLGITMVVFIAASCIYMSMMIGFCSVIMTCSCVLFITPVEIAETNNRTVVKTKLLGKL